MFLVGILDIKGLLGIDVALLALVKLYLLSKESISVFNFVFVQADICCIVGITFTSSRINVILDRVNVCGGPTTYRMRTVSRFAHVCNCFLAATLVIRVVQLIALFNNVLGVLKRYSSLAIFSCPNDVHSFFVQALGCPACSKRNARNAFLLGALLPFECWRQRTT
jgi:hypothetical protein